MGNAVVNTFVRFPGYTGGLIGGSVEIDWAMTFIPDLTGAVPLEPYTITVHSGVSCATEEDVGGDFYAPYTGPNPWATVSPLIADPAGRINGMFGLDFGYSDIIIGHALVIARGETPVACGIIANYWSGEVPTYETAVMAPIPSYKPRKVSGKVEVWDRDPGVRTEIVNYRLSGLAANRGGTVRIHAGLNCGSSGPDFYALVEGAITSNPWLEAKFTANGQGVAEGALLVTSGYNLFDNQNHAVVVHDSDAPATRMACGLLGGRRTTQPRLPPPVQIVCPWEHIMAAFDACTTDDNDYDYDEGFCSAPCSASVQALNVAFDALSASGPAIFRCLDSAESSYHWLGGSWPDLKDRLRRNVASLCKKV
jgi:hypothetical protein